MMFESGLDLALTISHSFNNLSRQNQGPYGLVVMHLEGEVSLFTGQLRMIPNLYYLLFHNSGLSEKSLV